MKWWYRERNESKLLNKCLERSRCWADVTRSKYRIYRVVLFSRLRKKVGNYQTANIPRVFILQFICKLISSRETDESSSTRPDPTRLCKCRSVLVATSCCALFFKSKLCYLPCRIWPCKPLFSSFLFFKENKFSLYTCASFLSLCSCIIWQDLLPAWHYAEFNNFLHLEDSFICLRNQEKKKVLWRSLFH